MTRIIIRSEKAEAAGAFADQFARALGDSAQRFREATSAAPSLRILGPAECPVFKLHDHYRFHFQIHSVSSEAMHEVLHEVMTTVRPPHGVEYQVDVDPYSML
jgi:primosomal protein N' (replication factor Y)